MKSKQWKHGEYQMPEEKELRIEYYLETDTLTLWNGTPASNGSSIAKDLMVFFDESDDAQIVTLEHAAELLRPLLENARHVVSNPTVSL